MNIDVINRAQDVKPELIEGKTAVVIDVLRATSVMTTAINNGVKKIIPVLTPEEAFSLKLQLGSNVVLSGERYAELIDGFDFGNSPLSFTPTAIEGKSLIITTSNGTLAIKNALGAKDLYIASFLNAYAICKQLSDKKEIVLICSGTNGKLTLEDNLCSGYIISLLEELTSCNLSDSAIVAHSLYTQCSNLQQYASQGYHYKVLEIKGFISDLEECFTLNKYDVVPFWKDGAIISNKP